MLSHITSVDPHVDKYAHFTIDHHDVLEGSGWEFLGYLDIKPEVAKDGQLVEFPPCRENWLLRGVVDSTVELASPLESALISV